MSSFNSNDGVPIYRPKPRRPFELNTSSGTSTPVTNGTESRLELPSWIDDSGVYPHSLTGASTPNGSQRTKSLLNLTTSTLFGIYSHTYSDGTEPPTPSFLSRTNSMVNVSDTSANGNGVPPANGAMNGTAKSNGKAKSVKQDAARPWRRRKRTPIPLLILRLAALLVFGIGYGVIVMHLHNTKTFTPAWWEEIEGYNIGYLLIWGVVGVALGSLLPWIDYFFGEDPSADGEGEERGGMMDWAQVVRSVGAFVGIAYAIRKLPWQSTLQVSLTLSLVNPFLWYLIDRTRSGLWLSSFVAIAGTMVLCQINPDMIQAPETHNDRLMAGAAGAREGTGDEMLLGVVSYETVGVGAWMWSVLFCSCVCFGNIGRKLALKERDL
ncbi:insulin-induced protein-domain-containing protein [Kalaharituber pfeilii]|nr:insulin-induced protein-domain-containing protein [Kalaharituber pfeilii]